MQAKLFFLFMFTFESEGEKGRKSKELYLNSTVLLEHNLTRTGSRGEGGDKDPVPVTFTLHVCVDPERPQMSQAFLLNHSECILLGLVYWTHIHIEIVAMDYL